MEAKEAIHIAIENLHMFADIDGSSGTMSGLSTVTPNPNTAIFGVLKNDVAFHENVKLLWRGIGTGYRRPVYFREPSALSRRCSARQMLSMSTLPRPALRADSLH